jgi:hypothetical protein
MGKNQSEKAEVNKDKARGMQKKKAESKKKVTGAELEKAMLLNGWDKTRRKLTLDLPTLDKKLTHSEKKSKTKIKEFTTYTFNQQLGYKMIVVDATLEEQKKLDGRYSGQALNKKVAYKDLEEFIKDKSNLEVLKAIKIFKRTMVKRAK